MAQDELENEYDSLKASVIAEHGELTSGPIPSARELQRYKDVDQSLPERIMKQFEEDSVHARQQAEKALEAEVEFDKRSQYLATFILALSLVLVAYLATIGADIAAVVVAVGQLFMLFKGTFSRKK